MEREEFLIQWTNYENKKAISKCTAFLINDYLYLEPYFFEKQIFSGTGITIPFDILKKIIEKLNENNIKVSKI